MITVRNILFVLTLLTTGVVYAQSPVWQVEKNGNRLFIGGSLHILAADNYPLPEAFDIAYDQAWKIVFEADIAAMESPAFQLRLLSEVSFTDGRRLRDVVNEETYLALEEHFASRGVPMAAVDLFKPGMVATLMTVVELQRLGINAVGVDAHLDQKARLDEKPTGQLETLEQQIGFISTLGAGQEDEMLRYSLADVERLPDLWKSMYEAWRSGDLEWLEQNVAAPMRDQFPAAYQTLLVKRNNAWIVRIEQMAATPQVEFVIVGALHLAGSDGLLDQLDARGYRITQLR